MERLHFVKTSVGHLIAVESTNEAVNMFLISGEYAETWLGVTNTIRIDGDETPEARELVFRTVAAISAGRFNPEYKN
jgi:hypothetical protein